MFANSLVFLLAYSVHSVSGYCRSTSHKPDITVANSTHLRINWANSFNKCDDIEVKSAKLRIRHKDYTATNKFITERIPVIFVEKQAIVKADPCLRHDNIRVELKYGSNQRAVNSFHSYYNVMHCENIQSQDLYSGLLQEHVLDQICKKDNGDFVIPDIPKEIQN